jgi:hypothetical protein
MAKTIGATGGSASVAAALVGTAANTLIDGLEARRGGAIPWRTAATAAELALDQLGGLAVAAGWSGVRLFGDLPDAGAGGFDAPTRRALRRVAAHHAALWGPAALTDRDAPWRSPTAEADWRRGATCPLCEVVEAPARGGPVTLGELLLGLGAAVTERMRAEATARAGGDRAGSAGRQALDELARPLLARAIAAGVAPAAGPWPVGGGAIEDDIRVALAGLAASSIPGAWRQLVCSAAGFWREWPWLPGDGGCLMAEGARHAAE